MDTKNFSSVGGGISERGHPQMCSGAGGMKMVAWGIFLSAPGRDEPIRRGNGPLSPTFIGQDGLRTYTNQDIKLWKPKYLKKIRQTMIR